jgi:hypothetical protein
VEVWQTEYQLLNSSPEFVFDWLKSNLRGKVQVRFGEGGRDELEEKLLAKSNPLINLGLALYAESSSVGYQLYQSGDDVIKKASLSGRSVLPDFLDDSWIVNDDVIPSLLNGDLSEGKSQLLGAALENENLPDGILESLFDKTELFSEVDDDTWLRLIVLSSKNKRLSTPYSSIRMDGYDEYKYKAVFTSAWKLFERAPVTKRAATVLERISHCLVPESPHDMNVLDVVERWRSTVEKEEEYYSYVRTALIRLLRGYDDEFNGLKEHDDLALRKGYYSFMRNVKVEDVQEGFEKDGKDFLDAAIYNDAFFQKGDTRSALSRACWDAPDEHSNMDYPNYYKGRESHLSEIYPEWFKDDWSGELPFEEIQDPEVRKEKRLEYLNTQVAELHKALLGDKTEYQEANEFGESSMMNDLANELREIGRQLGLIYNQKSFSWGWVIASLAVGFIIGKV